MAASGWQDTKLVMAKENKFFNEIKLCKIEREVEDRYNKDLNIHFPNIPITHPYACDGLFETKTKNNQLLKVLVEYKLNESLDTKAGRAKVLIQALFYIKQFELNGEPLPNICLIADINECFVIHTNELLKYLDEEINWKLAPSNAYRKLPDLTLKIANDSNINPFIFTIDEQFVFSEVVQKMHDLADNVKRYIRITPKNIDRVYGKFIQNVIRFPKKTRTHDLVGAFIGIITNEEGYYQHPTKKNILVTPLGNIDISGDKYTAFFSHFQKKYSPKEKTILTAIADRLIEDTDRRKSGDFWTPTILADYAHKMITEQLGENWKDEYVVWDNCCGGKNLTRDYRFKELYCSTLFASELQIGERYNKEATSFQFDFLNDELSKLPQGLIDAFEQNKPMVFFMNPPYARNNGGGIQGGTSESVAFTKINKQMKSDKIGGCSANLYAQFLYRITKLKKEYNLTNVHICIFCPTLYLAGESWKGFRKYYLNEFKYTDGAQFKASHFDDVADNWGISFSIWECGEEPDKNNFKFTLIDSVDDKVTIVGTKTVYNADNHLRCSDYVANNIKGVCDFPKQTSALNFTQKDGIKVPTSFLGTLMINSNNIDTNTQGVALFSGVGKVGGNHIVSIDASNFTRCTALFACRRLIEKNWINWQDEYLTPNEQHGKYQEFVNDSAIYSLFENKSNQSSLRQVEYKGKKWDIKNEFFWMSKDDVVDLADSSDNTDCYNDANTSEDRYVYKHLKTIKLSKEAQAVLDKATEIVRKTFPYRTLFDEAHPEYQINNWDCGWYQIKALAKEYMPEDFEQFKVLYKKLADKMRPVVYEVGFLK